MKLNWQKWGLDFFQSLGRHIGTAGLAWLAIGVKDGVVDWASLWVALLAGALLPTVFTFLQTTPFPETETVTTTTRVEQVSPPATPDSPEVKTVVTETTVKEKPIEPPKPI